MAQSLRITALGWLLLSLAHTVGAQDWQANAKFQSLPRRASACARAGWFQGSGFFVMNALVNYAWSRDPALLGDPVHRSVAGAMVAIMWVSGWWYARNGVAPNAVAVGVMGALQGYSALLR
ncbi:uncharacterized protein UV8b_06858 [Ustilaginoidea virens]|uniref:Integral membrane protein n=1 Tax=Ustilaginoidea virens TaxID=1159556 RepID=A0A8E5HW84_USTVR|nr:uncharacterized protein UV8b_06858 [Ustilaginoidea virens]QUC22617.1 hypothetical protein UV8b_06858 [Ustilaginoidea virens]